MRAGSLRHLITFQTISQERDEFGGVKENAYKDLKTVWASINPIGGNETFLSNADFAKTTHKIKIRYLDGINASMRIKFQDRFFNIVNVRNFNEENRVIEILAWESNNGN